jgi:hypothetical protein
MTDIDNTLYECSRCKAQVPRLNLELHEIRCRNKSTTNNIVSFSSSISSTIFEEAPTIQENPAFAASQTNPEADIDSSKYLQGRISHRLEDLDLLHEKFNWVPSSSQIRPNESSLRRKTSQIAKINEKWNSLAEYIYHTVFGCTTVEIDDKLYVPDADIRNQRRFRVSTFPYNLDGGGYHYVMWYGDTNLSLTDEIINDNIREEIQLIVGDKVRFQFAWYENPKMTVPDVYHVQVFWIWHL